MVAIRGEPDSADIPILMYHRINDELPSNEYLLRISVFGEQMKYLKDNSYKTMTFAQLIHSIREKRKIDGKYAVITFDDGWLDQFENAFPILKRNGFVATFNVISHKVKGSPQAKSFREGTDNCEDRVSWEQIKELSKSGMEIASHSRTHPFLTKATTDLNSEINGSKADFNNMGIRVETFAYPYSKYNENVMKAVENAGYMGARGWSGKNEITEYQSTVEFKRYYDFGSIFISSKTNIEKFKRDLDKTVKRAKLKH